MKNYAKYLVEFLGTFALTLVVALSLAGSFPVPTPVLAALTLGLFVYTVGHISGTHINPAITLGALSIKKIKLMDAVGYWIAQFAGAAAAFGVYSGISNMLVSLNSYEFPEGLSQGMLSGGNDPLLGLMEGLGAFFFAFGVAAVIYGRVPKDLTGIAVGGSLLMGISIAASLGGGVLNPAVALGLRSLQITQVFWYMVGPMVGAVLGMWAYKLVSEK